MKVDDDTFVNLPKLYHLLTEDKRFKNLKELLLGRCFCGSPRVFKVLSLTNVLTNKAVKHRNFEPQMRELFYSLFFIGKARNKIYR